MEWFINDLSLDGKFPDPENFLESLESLLKLREDYPELRKKLYCSRGISDFSITPTMNFREAVLYRKDKNFRVLVLSWINKSGPFWDEERQFNAEDYFEYLSQDVTDQGLGEAARRRLAKIEANVFSFTSSQSIFSTTPLQVQQGLPEEPISSIDIDNFWETAQMVNRLGSLKEYSCWHDVYIETRSRFGNLMISEFEVLMNKLIPIPFSQAVAKRIFDLLFVLDTLVTESDERNLLSIKGQEIFQQHFVGEKAWFTDESATNKEKFRKEMEFLDPENKLEKIFCPWHGKIKTPQIRIHFQWPRPNGQNKIKVTYIGPKITKR